MAAGSGQNQSFGLDVLYLAGFILKAETKEKNAMKYKYQIKKGGGAKFKKFVLNSFILHVCRQQLLLLHVLYLVNFTCNFTIIQEKCQYLPK